jgi:phosphoglucosamine mutase
MSNLGLEHALGRLGVGFARTEVGDRYVMARLKSDDGVLGGEQSGHIICRDRTSTGDGIVAALQVLVALEDAGQSLGDYAGEMQRYPQRLINVRLDEQKDIIGLAEVQDAVKSAELELSDHGRVLLRSSGTEPLIRVMVEGVDHAQVESIATRLADVVRAQIAG